jgi:SAM-dependent methyltransferase
MLGQTLLIPRVVWLSRRSSRDPDRGWNRYWAQVRDTGVGGDVLWDTGDLDEAQVYLNLMRDHLDLGLPLVDIGCGNGRFTRRLAAHVPSVLGVDLAANAIAHAVRESAGVPNLTYRVLDVAVPGATDPIAADLAPLNVFVRGVFHVLTPTERAAVARNLLPLVGTTGRVILTETNYRGGSLGYLHHLGATAGHIPGPLQRAIRTIPQPGRFGPEERQQTFPTADWTLISDGPTDVQTIPLRGTTEPEHIPGYYAILATRPDPSSHRPATPESGRTDDPAVTNLGVETGRSDDDDGAVPGPVADRH